MSRGQSHRHWLRSQAEMENQPAGKEGRQQIAGTVASEPGERQEAKMPNSAWDSFAAAW